MPLHQIHQLYIMILHPIVITVTQWSERPRYWCEIDRSSPRFQNVVASARKALQKATFIVPASGHSSVTALYNHCTVQF